MSEPIHIRADQTAACTDFVLNQIGNGAMAAPPPDEMEMFIEEWERDNNETLNEHERQCINTNIAWVYGDINPKKPHSKDRVMIKDMYEHKVFGGVNIDPARKFKPKTTKK